MWPRRRKPSLRSEIAAVNTRIAALGARLDEIMAGLEAARQAHKDLAGRLKVIEESPYRTNRDEALREHALLTASNPGIPIFED